MFFQVLFSAWVSPDGGKITPNDETSFFNENEEKKQLLASYYLNLNCPNAVSSSRYLN